MQQIYTIKGMNCQSCVSKIEQGMAAIADTVRVNLAEARIYLTAPRLGFEELKTRLAEIGKYELLPVKEKKGVLDQSRPYFPLLLIAVYLTVVSLVGAESVADWMQHFMAGFFLVFSFFKLLNLPTFAAGYAKYDLLAMRWRPYGFLYPFCELALGLAYLFGLWMHATLYATLALTLFSACGVIRSMWRKEEIRCACLGNLLNVPLSTVTLVEDFGMAAMAVGMIIAA